MTKTQANCARRGGIPNQPKLPKSRPSAAAGSKKVALASGLALLILCGIGCGGAVARAAIGGAAGAAGYEIGKEAVEEHRRQQEEERRRIYKQGLEDGRRGRED